MSNELALDRPIKGDITVNERNSTPQLGPTEFLEVVDSILNLPGVLAIRWEQYTPYFNDGDPCVFSVGDWRFKLDTEVDDEKTEYGDGYLTTWDDAIRGWEYRRDENNQLVKVRTHPGRPDIESAFKNLNLNAFEDVCRRNFGDHAQVTATKDGFEVEYYEHE
jgi:hypothetical protein